MTLLTRQNLKSNPAPIMKINHLVDEVAAAISINSINYAVVMLTPDDLEDFVVGFLFSQSVIKNNHDIHDIKVENTNLGLLINVDIANRCSSQLKQQKRQYPAAAGCGICGLEALEQAFPKLNQLAPSEALEFTDLVALRRQIQTFQVKAKQSGAIHAAFNLDEQTNITACREDIGRHNALDKLIGHNLRSNQQIKSVLVTSRCSSELIQKAILAKINNLVSLASPSQLAVNMAIEHGLNLIHIPKVDAPIYYCRTTLSQ
ncbi:iron ABC transporter substrate-binding protein [Catenovulum maritimum]|uniref:Iron ABC transporter substrate-binding protein n=2 Tax=Catenovulum maritimum TaxID=1513271 RepID=A0A0J8JIH8_9ALTE|nr:iron ABC transporter substrate-binding protein [Catenovulum maritimum]